MIKLENICKTFRVSRRNAWFKTAAKSLFDRKYETNEALPDISFSAIL